MLLSSKKSNGISINEENITIDSIGKTIITNNVNNNLRRISEASNKNFHLIILPTEQCNFRCTYCYEDFADGRMKPEIISGIKKFLEKRVANLEYLNVSWFGGEPLVAKNVVLEISQYVKSLASEYPQLNYIGKMTTNGYLLNENTVTSLVNQGVRRYQISLDGTREIHNKSRLRADGKGTFDQIWANLLAIRDSELPVSILLRIHFSADTFQLLDPLIEDLKKEFAGDSRFFFFFKAIGRLGGANDDAINVLSIKKREKAIKSFKNRLFGDNPSLLQNSKELDHSICYASRSNSLVIRSNGDIAKCTVAFYDKRNKVGTLQPDGTIELIPGRLSPWLRGLETLDPSTLRCPLMKLPKI